MNFPKIFYTVFLTITVTYSAKLPSYIKRCGRNDPNFNECYRSAIENTVRGFNDGAPEVGVNRLEPLHIDELVIGQGKGPVNVAQEFKNIELYGLTGSKVLWATIDFDKEQFYARSITPILRLNANYSMNGRILLLPIYGDGRCNVTLVNTKINHTLYTETYQRKSKTYYRVVDYTVTLRPERVEFDFENLFNGDELLGGEINKVLNENWNEVFTDVRPGYETSFGLIFKDIANRVLSRVPIKDLFLD